MPQPVNIPAESLRTALPFTTIASDALKLVTEAYTASRSGRSFAGLPTGLSSIDKALGGLQKGLHILAAEPGAGKTALALNIASNIARMGSPVIYASFDETADRLALKVLAARSGLCMSDMTAGKVPPRKVAEAFEQYSASLDRLSFMPADSSITPTDLIDQLRDRLAYHEALSGLLVVDYLQPWAAVMAAGKHTEFRMAVGAVALELRRVASETNCPVLLISAQNRTGQGTAKMTSLRESSDLEYGADSIMLLTHDDTAMVGMDKKAITLTLAKNRFGQSGLQLPLVLDGRYHTVNDADGAESQAYRFRHLES